MVNNLKVEHVKKLLDETDLTLKNIIDQVGYIDPSGFIRKFKQYVGMTPGQYKNIKKLSNDKNS